VTGGFNNLYDVLNISVYDVHMFSSACIPVFLFLHLLWEGLVSILWKSFGFAAAAAALYYYFYI
jgi:hypothetical protein